jgi:hypothetical protein
MVRVKEETTVILMGFPFRCHNFDGPVNVSPIVDPAKAVHELNSRGGGAKEALEKVGFPHPLE